MAEQGPCPSPHHHVRSGAGHHVCAAACAGGGVPPARFRWPCPHTPRWPLGHFFCGYGCSEGIWGAACGWAPAHQA